MLLTLRVRPETQVEINRASGLFREAWKVFRGAKRMYCADLGIPFVTRPRLKCLCPKCCSGAECGVARTRRLKTARNQRWLAKQKLAAGVKAAA